MIMGKTCCVTGHRPNTFPWKDHAEDTRLQALLKRIDTAVDTALSLGTEKFICGNALGVDTWTAQIVLEKKKLHPEIYLEIALPFALHNNHVDICRMVQAQADLVHVVSTSKSRMAAYFDRNKYMVDNSDIIIAVYDGEKSPKSGTQKTFEMAEKMGLKIIQVPWGDI